MTSELHTSERRLTTDMVSDPAMYRLILAVRPTSLDVVILSRVRENDVIFRHIDFQAGSDTLSALEEAVYDNPLLTADFHRIDVMVENNRFFIMASEEATDDEKRRRIAALWPPEQTEDDLQAMENVIEDGRTTFVWAIERRLIQFMRRTWNNPSVHHRLGVLTRYYTLKSHLGNMGKVNVCVWQDKTDVIVSGRDGLLMANTFATPGGTEDAVYYTMATAQHFDFNMETDRIIVGGESAMRAAFIESARRFVPLTMPEIYPSAINTLTASQKDIPYEALLLTLL